MNGLIRLPLQGAYNVRDIGGYACDSGKGVTKFRVFLRADDLSELTGSDMDFLKEYGLRTIIDLRGTDESAKRPDPFDESVDYVNIPLIAGAISELKFDVADPRAVMKNMYMHIVKDGGDAIRQVFDAIAEHDEGVVLFHCLAGKDRTGIIAALLMMLAGVERIDVLVSYCVTEKYDNMDPETERLYAAVPAAVLASDIEYIAWVYDYIVDTYGDVRHYLESIGVSEEKLDKIKNRLVRPFV